MKLTSSKSIVNKTIPLPTTYQKPPNINELLKRPPEELAALPDEDLRKLLEPYIPTTRLALMPQEKPRKMGVETRAVLDIIEQNKEAISKLRAARGTP